MLCAIILASSKSMLFKPDLRPKSPQPVLSVSSVVKNLKSSLDNPSLEADLIEAFGNGI